MSFGVGIGDFISVGQLARTVYKQCRDSPTQYRHLAKEALQLANILEDLEDHTQNQRLTPRRQDDLLCRVQGCKEVLTDLQYTLAQSESLGTVNKRLRQRLAWDQQEVRDTRMRLLSNLTMLSSFWDSLHTSSLFNIQEALDEIKTSITAAQMRQHSLGIPAFGTHSPYDETLALLSSLMPKRPNSMDLGATQNITNIVSPIPCAINRDNNRHFVIPGQHVSNSDMNQGSDSVATEQMKPSHQTLLGTACLEQDSSLGSVRILADLPHMMTPPVDLILRPPSVAPSLQSIYVDALETIGAEDLATPICSVGENNNLVAESWDKSGVISEESSDTLKKNQVDQEFTIQDRRSRPSFQNLSTFLDHVKLRYPSNYSTVYEDLVSIARDLQDSKLPTTTVQQRTQNLLVSGSYLLEDLNTFIPLHHVHTYQRNCQYAEDEKASCIAYALPSAALTRFLGTKLEGQNTTFDRSRSLLLLEAYFGLDPELSRNFLSVVLDNYMVKPVRYLAQNAIRVTLPPTIPPLEPSVRLSIKPPLMTTEEKSIKDKLRWQLAKMKINPNGKKNRQT